MKNEVTTVKTEIVTLTSKQIESCIKKIKDAEKSGVKSTWTIAENLNKLVINNVSTDEIVAETHYNKSTISRLSRTFEMLAPLPDDFKSSLTSRYGVNTIAETLPLKFDYRVLQECLRKLEEREIPYTSKEVRNIVKSYLQLDCKEAEVEAETEAEAEAEATETTDFDKKEFINYLIFEYNISEKDAEILKTL